jgi:hypothetical protein
MYGLQETERKEPGMLDVESAMPKVEMPEDLLKALGELAIAFVDKEPADVVRRLVKKEMEAKTEEAVADDVQTFSTTAPPDLSHTKVLMAKINGAVMQKPNWNRLMDEVITLAAKRLKDADALSKIVLAKHVKAEKIDQGYEYFPAAKISVQGQDSNHAWKTAAHIAKELGYTIEVTFSWYDNPKASNPGKAGKFVIG